jgi:hypothetical protein
MQVDINELAFIKANAPKGLYSVVADRLIEKGYKTTRFIVAKEVSTIKDDYRPEIINEIREVFALLSPTKVYKPDPNK